MRQQSKPLMPWPHLPESKGPSAILSQSRWTERSRNLRSNKKMSQDSIEPCDIAFANLPSAILRLYALDYTTLLRSGVINAHLLTGAQRGGYDFAHPVDDSRSCAQREANRSLIAPDHNCLARLIGSYRTGSIGCGCCLRCRCWFCGCGLLSRCRARLRKS